MRAASRLFVVPLLLLMTAAPAFAGALRVGPAPGLRSLAAARTAPAPGAPLIAILCYHDVSDAPGTPASTVSPAAPARREGECARRGRAEPGGQAGTTAPRLCEAGFRW